MERIICDTYVKGEKHVWSSDKDNPSNQEFNRKILAVNEMYGWLYEKGILRDISFEFKDYSDVTFFALDVKDLEPYRVDMAASGLKDVDVALQHIFDEYYTPCEYSGAIELGWTMRGYRDVDGTVSRSWECGLVKGLNTGSAYDVLSALEEHGVKAAVKAAFEFAGFEPSDIANCGKILSVRPLTEEDSRVVSILDMASGNCVSQWIEDNEDYAWGVFADDKLVGYCTIGYADECGGEIKAYPGHTSDSLLLSDVFVAPAYRGQGCGAFLVNEAVKRRTENDKQLVFLVVLDDRLSCFYKEIGFSAIGNGAMVRDERPLEVQKLAEDFAKAFEHYSSIDKSMLDQRDYLFSHADKLIEGYERGEHLDLLDFDCWVQYEKLLGESLGYDEYSAVNSVLDGDPHDIEETDVTAISFLRGALACYRNYSVLDIIDDANNRSNVGSVMQQYMDFDKDMPF